MFFKNVEDAFLMRFCSENNPQNHSKIDKKLIKNQSKIEARKMIEKWLKMPPQEEGLAPKPEQLKTESAASRRLLPLEFAKASL